MIVNDQSVFINFEAHTQRSHQASRPAASATTKVVLSPKARELKDARLRLIGLPNVDARRVAQIQLQIENGTYTIDAGRIAERMLEEMQLNSGL